jgi:hypothetical protein
MSIQATLKAHERRLLALPNVTGVGIGQVEGREVILAFVKDPGGEPAARAAVPRTLDGFEVVVQPELRLGEPDEH